MRVFRRYCSFWAFLLAVGLMPTVSAQRVQFPSAVSMSPASTGATVPYSVGQPAYGAAVSPPPAWDAYATGTPGTTPLGPPPATTPYGTSTPIHPTHPTPVYPQPPGTLYPGGGPFSWQQGGYSYQAPDGTMTRMQRFVQNVGLEYTWLAVLNDDEKKFGINRAEVWSTFGFPLFYNTETPLRVTPGFAVNMLEGPVTISPGPPDPADLPPRLFDAYLDTAWEPRVNEWLSGDLGLRVGVYSDFSRVNGDSIRYMGRGLGVLSFTPTIKVAAGVWYLDRNRVKLLPAGGVIWTPNPDTNFRILFPNPKLSHRFTTVGTAEWWWYFTGEYGGGAWTVKRDNTINNGVSMDRIDYNDMRISFGLEWIGQRGVRGHIEVGYVWDREIVFDESKSPKSWKPNDTVMIRAGIDY